MPQRYCKIAYDAMHLVIMVSHNYDFSYIPQVKNCIIYKLLLSILIGRQICICLNISLLRFNPMYLANYMLCTVILLCLWINLICSQGELVTMLKLKIFIWYLSTIAMCLLSMFLFIPTVVLLPYIILISICTPYYLPHN